MFDLFHEVNYLGIVKDKIDLIIFSLILTSNYHLSLPNDFTTCSYYILICINICICAYVQTTGKEEASILLITL